MLQSLMFSHTRGASCCCSLTLLSYSSTINLSIHPSVARSHGRQSCDHTSLRFYLTLFRLCVGRAWVHKFNIVLFFFPPQHRLRFARQSMQKQKHHRRRCDNDHVTETQTDQNDSLVSHSLIRFKLERSLNDERFVVRWMNINSQKCVS